ncbi:GNAT family N-acetyltransferase, partial [Dietzia lutea]
GGGGGGNGGGDTFVVDSPMGRVSVRFLPRNELGVLDHEVALPDGNVTYNPLRVVPHPEGAEVIFTLRGVDDDEFERDAAMVAEDLARLRAVFEGPLPAGAPPSSASAIADPGIRLASPADAGTLGRMLYEFNTEFESATPTADYAARRFGDLLARDDVLAVVAAAGIPGGPDVPTDAGFALLTLRPTPYSDHPLAQLEELYVRPDLRGRGLGTAILTRALSEVAARRCEEMLINVDSDDLGARRFYERHGFTDRDPDSGSGMRCYLRQL